MGNIDIKECAERIKALTGAYSELKEHTRKAVRIPEIVRYKTAIKHLEILISAESKYFTELMNEEEHRTPE